MYITKYKALYNETSRLIENQAYPQYIHFIDAVYDKVKTGFKYPVHNAFNALMDKDTITELKRIASLPGKSACFFACGNLVAPSNGCKETKQESETTYKYNVPSLAIANIYGGQCANVIGWTDNIATDASACISSFKSLFDAQVLLEHYGYDRAIIIALEEQTTNPLLEFFGSSGATLTKKRMDAEGIVPSAFDSKNGGFFLGHGAAFVVLESEKSMKETGNTPIAKMLAVTTNGESCHGAIGQRADGLGYEIAIREAMFRSGVKEFDIIKTHGTGTASNNTAEAAALRRVFSEDFIATSYKSRIGHTMGASGLIEMTMMLDDANNRLIRGILNRTEYDEQFLSHDLKMHPKNVLLLASGMGNGYAAASLEIL
jgi:3-oxoacyl-(acyl-carrier-protein) synthase